MQFKLPFIKAVVAGPVDKSAAARRSLISACWCVSAHVSRYWVDKSGKMLILWYEWERCSWEKCQSVKETLIFEWDELAKMVGIVVSFHWLDVAVEERAALRESWEGLSPFNLFVSIKREAEVETMTYWWLEALRECQPPPTQLNSPTYFLLLSFKCSPFKVVSFHSESSYFSFFILLWRKYLFLGHFCKLFLSQGHLVFKEPKVGATRQATQLRISCSGLWEVFPSAVSCTMTLVGPLFQFKLF